MVAAGGGASLPPLHHLRAVPGGGGVADPATTFPALCPAVGKLRQLAGERDDEGGRGGGRASHALSL